MRLRGLATAFAIVSASMPVLGQTPALRPVSQIEALDAAVNLPVWPGRSTQINFIPTGETVTYILIGDKSRATYTTNAPLESGSARVVFVRPIQPLYFPGSTTAYVTNLSVLTSTPSGQSRSYVFNLVPASNPVASSGVTIDPGVALSFDPPPRVTGGVDLRDVERGLRRAIARGFTPESDEIVNKVRSCINAVRSGSPLDVALLGNSLDLEVWQSLAQLGAEVRQGEFVPLEPDVPSSPTPILTPEP